MKRLALLVIVPTVVLAACDHAPRIVTPTPAATATPTEGGPCGDGRILRPGEHCP